MTTDTENYRPISRSFRPQSFADVMGQEGVVSTLKNALTQKRVAHAYLFSGTRGTGKTTIARIFAKALNCLDKKSDGEPCLLCASCKGIAEGFCLDVIEIDGASHRGIDDIRQINEAALFSRPPGTFCVFIIDEVHMLTKEAFNALLKTLEEPPDWVKFIFATTEPHKVPMTILSRCQRFALTRLDPVQIMHKLTRVLASYEVSFDKEALEILVDRAEGSMRDAESMLERVICFAGKEKISAETVRAALGLLPKVWLESLDKAMVGKDPTVAQTLLEELGDSFYEPTLFLELLIGHFRAHLQRKDTPFSKEVLFSIFHLLMDTLAQTSKIHFRKLHLEMVVMQMIRLAATYPIDRIIKELLSLKEEIPHKEALSQVPEKNESSQALFEQKQVPDTKIKDENLMQFTAVTLGGILS